MARVAAEAHWMLSATRAGEPLPAMITMRWRWYKDAAVRHRRRYAATELLAICAAASVPVAAAARLDAVVVAVLGAVVLVATGVRTTFQLHENWIEHSRVRYAIEREVALWLVESPPYEGTDAMRTLITRIEDLAQDSGDRWAARRAQVDQPRTQPPATAES